MVFWAGVWSEVREAQPGHPAPQLDGSLEDNLDLPHRGLADSSADLSCDSRVNSDYETDGEGYTDGEGGPYTDVDEGPPEPALVRSSEPVPVDKPQSLQDHGRPSGHRGAPVSRVWDGAGQIPGDPVFCQDDSRSSLLTPVSGTPT